MQRLYRRPCRTFYAQQTLQRLALRKKLSSHQGFTRKSRNRTGRTIEVHELCQRIHRRLLLPDGSLIHVSVPQQRALLVLPDIHLLGLLPQDEPENVLFRATTNLGLGRFKQCRLFNKLRFPQWSLFKQRQYGFLDHP